MASVEEMINKNEIVQDVPEVEVPEVEEKAGFDFSFIKRIMSAESPDTPIESYIEHPLNFGHSKGLARALRGFEGVFGNLRLAVFDIIFGVFEFAKERKLKNDTVSGAA